MGNFTCLQYKDVKIGQLYTIMSAFHEDYERKDDHPGAYKGQLIPKKIKVDDDTVLMTTQSFDELAAAMTGVAIRTCIISFPSTMSLKGSLEEQYGRHGVLRWSRQERREFALRLSERAARRGLRLMACNQV